MNLSHSVWSSVLGFEPPYHSLPTFLAPYFVYLSIFVICFTLYQLAKLLTPQLLREYVLDYIKCLTFVAYPWGHGLARRFYGHPGYLISMVPVNSTTALLMNQGQGNPLGVWGGYLRGAVPLWKLVVKCTILIFAGISAYNLGLLIMSVELHPVYTDIIHKQCETDLKIPAYYGFLLEMFGSLLDSWVGLQALTRSKTVNVVISFVFSGILVIIGVGMTGMYLHPAMATGHSFGCGDTPFLNHILVYWLAPFMGMYWATVINRKFHLQRPTGKENLNGKTKSVDVDKEKNVTEVHNTLSAVRKRNKRV
ncbi:hypothetical protein ACJMK2_023225 [Sinanodonta woodiana]|uniref:Aquaporin n=1 Tax=Sinanodonta woodiana TaxID=1069815 RepID=A0ABD3T3J2_SINWO